MSIAESARILGIPPSTARSRYATAKSLLRTELGDEYAAAGSIYATTHHEE